MKTVKFVMAILCLFSLALAQFGDSSGIGAGLMGGSNVGFGSHNSGSSVRSEPEFFHDGRDGDLRSIWSFGVNGFFIPPPDFAGLPFLATNGTIIPTAAVGLICFDGVGGCTLELTAVVGGNLGRQVFNVSMNKVRFISSLCRVRVSRLGRVVLTAKLSEVSSRLLPMSVLSVPIVVVAQLASRQLAFIEFDQLFVMQGQAVRIRRFDNFLNNNNNQDDRRNNGKDGVGGGMSIPGGPAPGPGAGSWGGDVMGGNFGNDHNNNNNDRNQNRMCPNLLDDSQFSDGSGSNDGGNRGNWGGGYGAYGGDGGGGGAYDGY